LGHYLCGTLLIKDLPSGLARSDDLDSQAHLAVGLPAVAVT
jgi:hypothetical protein